MPALPAYLFEALRVPDLPGAACAHLAPAFDYALPGEWASERQARHDRAATVCGGCPVLARCAALAAEQPPASGGVWAGAVHPPTKATTAPRAA